MGSLKIMQLILETTSGIFQPQQHRISRNAILCFSGPLLKIGDIDTNFKDAAMADVLFKRGPSETRIRCSDPNLARSCIAVKRITAFGFTDVLLCLIVLVLAKLKE